MELIKNTINICNIAAKGETQAMSDGDVIVPDIKPDILKLLQVDADACITDKYIENGRLIICGRVDYKVLYVPDSEKEKIKSILTSMEFRQAVDAGNAKPESKIILKPTVERVEFSAVNSRKLRIRAIVHIEYEVSSIENCEICNDISDSEIEKIYNDVTYENTVDISEHDFTVKETLEIPSGASSAAEVLKADVRIYDTEYKSVTGKVIVKGICGICVLYTDDDGEIRFVESEVPFTEVLDAEGVGEDTVCDIEYSLLGVMCDARPDTDGDMRLLCLDIDISAAIKGTEIKNTKLIKDCFMPYMKTDVQSKEIVLRTTVERPESLNTIREVIAFPQNVPEVSGVYNVMTNTVMTKSELSKNKILCEGKVEAYILYLTNSTENPVYSFKKDIPFSYMIECKNSTEALDCEIKSGVKHVSYNLNSGGEVELRCLISIECMLIKEERISTLYDVSITEAQKSREIVICFAHNGERVWDIAKRYGIPQESLNRHNDLEGEVIEGEKRLFIPGR